MNSMISSVPAPGVKTSATPSRFSSGMSSAGMVPPTVTRTSSTPCVFEQRDDFRDQGHVGAGEDREADRVGVLLDHRLGDLLGRLVQAGVDDLHAGVAEGAGDDLGAAVVAVEAGLGDDDADLAGGCGLHRAESSRCRRKPAYLPRPFGRGAPVASQEPSRIRASPARAPSPGCSSRKTTPRATRDDRVDVGDDEAPGPARPRRPGPPSGPGPAPCRRGRGRRLRRGRRRWAPRPAGSAPRTGSAAPRRSPGRRPSRRSGRGRRGGV